MPTLNSYQNIDEIERESRKDYIDRHSPFVTVAANAKKGEKLKVNVKVGKEYLHPDDFDHYIADISLFDGETQLTKASYFAGANGGQGNKSQLEVDFYIVPTSAKLKLKALSYCTKHGLWQSDEVLVTVSE